ncbi:MAG: BamA/TamA family outer membrane protein, partial [Litorimonas sp.]
SLSQNRRNISLSFGEPRFLGRELSASIQIFDSEIDFLQEAGFRQSSRGGTVSFGFRLTENTSLSARYSLRNQELDFPDSGQCDAILGANGTGASVAASNIQLVSLCEQVDGQLSSILGYTFNWDKRNDPITPTRGFNFRFGQDLAGIGGDVKYLRTDAEANFYRGLIPGVVSSLRLVGGYIRGWGGDSVTVNDRYFKGSFDFRGFDNAGVGPRTLTFNADTGSTNINGVDGRGQALGGNLFGLATAEVSFPVGVPQLTGSLWAEAGTVGFLDEDQRFNIILDPGTSGLTAGDSCEGVTTAGVLCQRTADDLALRSIIGASVFWESPFGPIRFDFTKPIVEVDFDDRKSFQFTTRTRF